jgi:hypothetical protein
MMRAAFKSLGALRMEQHGRWIGIPRLQWECA